MGPRVGVLQAKRRLFLSAGGIAAVAVGTLAVVAWLWSAAPPIVPVPRQNGYDDLLHAASLVVGVPPAPAPMMLRATHEPPPWVTRDWEGLRNYVGANQEALRSLRVGLEKECVVPVRFERGYAFATLATRDALKRPVHLVLCEARVHEADGKLPEAMRSYLDAVRFGHAIARGGLEGDEWAGYDAENAGLAGLAGLAGRLGPAECREAVRTLAALDRRREPHGHFVARQEKYDEAEHGRVVTALRSLAPGNGQERWLEASAAEVVANLRLTALELAIRARTAQGKPPAALEELVPEFFPEVPVDPFSGRPFVYRRSGAGHTLYSIGSDRKDNGGADLRRSRQAADGDLKAGCLGSTL